MSAPSYHGMPISIRFATIIILVASLGYIVNEVKGTAWALLIYTTLYSFVYTWFPGKKKADEQA